MSVDKNFLDGAMVLKVIEKVSSSLKFFYNIFKCPFVDFPVML